MEVVMRHLSFNEGKGNKCKDNLLGILDLVRSFYFGETYTEKSCNFWDERGIR
jgi:hypothetical protein